MNVKKLPSLLLTALFVLTSLWFVFLSFDVFALVLSSNGPGAKSFELNAPTPLEMFGQMGDAFGILNSLMSSLAIAGTLVAISLQRVAIADQEKHHRQEQQRAALDLKLQKIETVICTLHKVRDYVITNSNEVGSDRFDHNKASHFIVNELEYARILCMIHHPGICTHLIPLIESARQIRKESDEGFFGTTNTVAQLITLRNNLGKAIEHCVQGSALLLPNSFPK